MPSVLFLCQAPVKRHLDERKCWYKRKWSLHRAGEDYVHKLRVAHGLPSVDTFMGHRIFDSNGCVFGMVLCKDAVFHGHIGTFHE